MRKITIAMRSGGTGKTTTAQLLAIGLARNGFKTLLIDLDSQCNLTDNFDTDADTPTIYDVLNGSTDIRNAIQTLKDVHFIGGSEQMVNITSDYGKTSRIADALRTIESEFDYCVMDCPPSLDMMTLNAISCCDDLIIPIQADKKSVKGIMQIANTLKRIGIDNGKINGILLTRVRARQNCTKIVKSLLDDVVEFLDTKLYKTAIRECVAFRDADNNGVCVYDYAPKSNATTDYKSFVDEYLNKGE